MRAVAIVQARLNSQRFPRKVLADLCGKPVIQHVVERADRVRSVAEVVLACPADDLWGFVALRPNAEIVGHTEHGDESDVLSRFREAAKLYPAERYLRITGDSPFLSPQLAERVLACVEGGAQYACTRHDGGQFGWPDGLDVEAFTAGALYQADKEALPEEREHVTTAMRRVLPADRQATVPFPPGYEWPAGCKLSIDTPSDLEYAREVMGRIRSGTLGYGWINTYQAVVPQGSERGL